ncbi:hypothetical protein J4429_05020 [Candidatus Pacearchaeota archaeon]|nr:hypothetical protein [Candidatus Pacearchaeota archaeon]
MTKKLKIPEPSVHHWEMERDISREVNFRTPVGDMYHGLVISRFPGEIKLAEFGSAPFRERTSVRGLTQITSGLDAHLMIVPQRGLVVADARLSLDYADESSCGPEYLIEGYFSNGDLVSVYSPTERVSPYLAKLRESMREPPAKQLKTVFKGLLQDRLDQIPHAFERIQELVENSDLPSHYKDAVKEIL